MRRPTMRDVAAAAGVSFKTVSRVVNDEGGVSEDLVGRVAAAIDELGYRPDHRARGLRQSAGPAATIGFILVDVANPFFGSILRGIEEVATSRQCLVLAGSTDGSPEREGQLVEAFVGRRVDGLIVVPSSSDLSPIRAEMQRGTPTVFLDIEPERLECDIVRSDHFEGARAATRHLLGHGHTDIAYFGDDVRIFSAGLRAEGFRRSMADAGINVEDRQMVTGSHSAEEWRGIVLDHFALHGLPTAVFSAQNYVSVGVARALNELGLRHRLAQVGFDEVGLADLLEPGLSYIPQLPRNLGRQAAELLFERLAGNDGPPQRQIITNALIPLGSGEIRPPHS